MENDLISRSKAIRWIKAECNPYGQPTLDYESGIKVIEHLERMSSAQPRIMTCSKCNHKTKCFSQIAATNKYQTTTIFYDIDFCSRWENEDNE